MYPEIMIYRLIKCRQSQKPWKDFMKEQWWELSSSRFDQQNMFKTLRFTLLDANLLDFKIYSLNDDFEGFNCLSHRWSGSLFVDFLDLQPWSNRWNIKGALYLGIWWPIDPRQINQAEFGTIPILKQTTLSIYRIPIQIWFSSETNNFPKLRFPSFPVYKFVTSTDDKLGDTRQVLSFEEGDWPRPGPGQCDIFNLPLIDHTQCDVDHPNNTEIIGVLPEIDIVMLPLNVVLKMIWCLVNYVVCGVVLASGILLDHYLQKRQVKC